MKNLILEKAPLWMQNAAISGFNRHQWFNRQRGEYQDWFAYCNDIYRLPRDDWEEVQNCLLTAFLDFASTHANGYRDYKPSAGLAGFPILEKSTLIEGFQRIATISETEGIVSFTGGTTGASMKVVYTLADTQKRAATLDWFRAQSGWSLGRRTAWFSGKSIVREKDIAAGNCFRDDWLTKTRFFSTFHINERTFEHYWRSLIEFNPEFVVGFPSSLSEILSIAKAKGLTYPHRVKTIFPTAETVLPYHRRLFEEMLGAQTRDQYASSEGAPFITECTASKLHILPHTGIFEVIDEDGNPAREGEMLVTAFHTHGTPLIRYRVGDRIALAPEGATCECGSSFPLVDRIDGRNAEFIWSPKFGRINLGNLSNSTKGVEGIIAFRVTQKDPNAISVEVHGSDKFDEQAAEKLMAELRKRTGEKMDIAIERRDSLSRKKSGKFQIVDNQLSPEQMRF